MDIVLKRDPDRADVDAVLEPLIAYNDEAAGRKSGHQAIAKDDDGKTTGGLTGRVMFDWLFIELLAVPASERRSGLGTKLMQQAEDFARAEGLAGIWLDTFHFQARPFYEKLGYKVFGTIENHPRGGARHFLQKSLD